MRSDIDIERQVSASGATWLDRQGSRWRSVVAASAPRCAMRWTGAQTIWLARVSPDGNLAASASRQG
nr:hypothetical protein [uncultured Rhizobium sp.]